METTNEATPVASATKQFQCKHCPKTFLHKIGMDQHILNQHGKDKLKIKPLHCSECLKTNQVTKYFSKQHLLNSHIREVHSQRRFECDICFSTFIFPSHFKTHRLIHSTDINAKFECDLCSKVFSAHKSLKRHLFYKHDRKPENGKYLTCDLCSQTFLERSHLENHVLAKHVADKPFECDICSKTFIDQKTLTRHLKLHDRPVKYFCQVCSKGYKDKASLFVHLGAKHNKFFHCYKCSRYFTNKLEFDQHLISRNSWNLNLEFKCPSCSKILPSQCTFTIHTNSHSKPIIKTEKEIEAPMKKWDATDSSRTEEDTEQREPEIKCQLCSKIFDRESHFATHRKQVHPNADWTCDFEHFELCTKSFKENNKLILHETTHSASKPYVCPTCHKCFSFQHNLKRHQNIHLDDKPFKCEMCPKSFVCRVSQRFHIANKHGGSKPFKCPVTNCGKSFPSNPNLNTHLITHETVKPFKCNICTKQNKEFKGLAHLKQHLRVVHSVGIGLYELKYADSVVFTCTFKDCSFETGSDKEVAIHYNEQHGLPKVALLKNNNIKIEKDIYGSVPFLSWREIPKFKTSRMILKRYKCKFCLKLLCFSSFKPHQETCRVKAAFKCTHCSKTFRFKNTLNKHIGKFHHNKKC